jgi:ATP synthase protein I
MDDGRDDFERRFTAAQDAARRGGTAERSVHASAGAGQSAVNLAMRLGVEVVAAMVIAVTIGWGLDRLFHTRPWMMVVMVPVGMAAGLRNLVRAVGPANK